MASLCVLWTVRVREHLLDVWTVEPFVSFPLPDEFTAVDWVSQDLMNL